MADTKAAWDTVGESFATLGRRLKEHYDARVASGETPDRSQIEEALETLADALERAVEALGDSLRDKSVHTEARKAVASLGEALAVTFGEIGEQIHKAFGIRDDPPAE